MPVVNVPYENAPETHRILSKEEREAIDNDRLVKDLRQLEAGRAKFKIELLFTSTFSIIKPVPGVMSFWESGSQLHGGGDAIIHFCPGKKLGKSECEAFIPDPSHGYGFLVCPKCHNVWNGDDVWGQVAGRHTAQQWAQLIERYYRRLGMNCDVVIKYHKNDIRAAHAHRAKEEKLGLVRSAPMRLKRIYTLPNLMRDMSAGSSLYDRILAFVRA